MSLRAAIARATDSAGRIHWTRSLAAAIDEADARHTLACAWGLDAWEAACEARLSLAERTAERDALCERVSQLEEATGGAAIYLGMAGMVKQLRSDLVEARAETEAIASGDDGTVYGPDLLRAAPALLAEIDRLRALPVIATCGACPAHAEVGDEGPNGADGIGYVCGQHYELHATAPGDTPPSWCPLRGGR